MKWSSSSIWAPTPKMDSTSRTSWAGCQKIRTRSSHSRPTRTSTGWGSVSIWSKYMRPESSATRMLLRATLKWERTLEIRRCRAGIAVADLLQTEKAIRTMTLKMMTRITSTAEGLKRCERHELSLYFDMLNPHLLNFNYYISNSSISPTQFCLGNRQYLGRHQTPRRSPSDLPLSRL